MEFNHNFMQDHDPFKYIETRRVPRASMESTGSRRSIPSCPRVPSEYNTSLTADLFLNN